MPDPDATYDINIWTVAADNTDKGAQLTQVTKNPGEDVEPSWSPDGKWITYTTRLDPKEFEYGTKPPRGDTGGWWGSEGVNQDV